MYIKTEELKNRIINSMNFYKNDLKLCIYECDKEWVENYISVLNNLKSELEFMEKLESLYNFYEKINDFDNLEFIAKGIIENNKRIINEIDFVD